MRDLREPGGDGANVKAALVRLFDVVLVDPTCAPGSDVCADVERLSMVLHRAFELDGFGDLDADAGAALAVVVNYSTTAGLEPFPHCDGCGIKDPFWSDRLAEGLRHTLSV